jgi:hypothetical protein
MFQMNRRLFAFLCLFVSFPLALTAQTLDPQGAVKAAVVARYHLTQATADDTDVVTAGDVITFLKSGMILFTVTGGKLGHTLSYHDGKFNLGGFSGFSTVMASGPNSADRRTFVSGEKCWLIDVDVKPDGVYLLLLTDPINNIRYMGTLKFPVDKKQPMPPPDVMLSRISEVISASGSGASQPVAAAPSAPAPPPPAPIAPPPPPPDEPAAAPPTISLGQTKDQVKAAFGTPDRVVKLGTKEIEYFKDMKVTFVNGKVTDVQ